jgi:hypothetical protein
MIWALLIYINVSHYGGPVASTLYYANETDCRHAAQSIQASIRYSVDTVCVATLDPRTIQVIH